MAIDLQAIRDEIDGDPLTRGYAGMTDKEVSDDMNTKYRGSINNLTHTQFLGIISGNWPSDTANRDYCLALLGLSRGNIPTKELKVRNKLTNGGQAIFGGPTATALEDAWGIQISRAVELEFGKVRPGTIAEARALP